ncbi:uncharacterized protein M6B38_103870 [Iris pallida]|uniref:rRNA methylase n=1 Tax=Iris pallida TaxID=29817 RepID=A0AAX6F3A3_IRIPA|nr:uncharacterized protein M6B38_103870 [Iris pallida]
MATCKTLIRTSLLSPFPNLGLGLRGIRPSSTAVSSSSSSDTFEELLSKSSNTDRLMKMERRSGLDRTGRWFPYLDLYKAGSMDLASGDVIAALDPCLMEPRKERIRRAVQNRSYSVCLVVEGLTDFGNVSAAFRSADALGIQSVHVISSDSKKRYRDNRHVSMGAENG